MKILCRLFSAVAFTFLASGCGSDNSAINIAMKPVPVKGTVTLKGKPLTQGTIRFEPDSGGREAQGDIQPDGSFVLTTFDAKDGAVEGEHRVAVMGAGGGKKDPVPLKYHNYSSSGIVVEVSADKTDYTIELR